MNRNRIVVTGAAGFIGSHLCKYFLEKGYTVFGIDNFLTGTEENIFSLKKFSAFDFLKADITDENVMMSVLKKDDIVFHQAALGSVPRSVENPLRTHHHNATGFLNVTMACIRKQVKRLIFASSSSVYGDSTNIPKKEDILGKPLSPYAVSKLSNEYYAYVLGLHYNLEWIGLRYFNVFGENQQAGSPYAAVVPLFMEALMNRKKAVIYGDGLQQRDFTYVENVCLANEKAMLAPENSCRKMYNIGCGEKITVLDLYNKIRAEVSKFISEVKDLEPQFLPERKGDIRNSLADISLAKEFLGYSPAIHVEEGIRRLVSFKIMR